MYSSADWPAISSEYATGLRDLVIPLDPTPAAIMDLQSRIDQLFTSARLDYGRLKAELESLKQLHKVLSRAYYLDFKDQGKTEKEREALVQRHIMQNHQHGDSDLITAIALLEEQVLFMQTVVDILKDKSQRLITHLGSLKLEQSLMAVEVAAENQGKRLRAL